MPRFHCPALLATGAELDLPPGAARHVQVLRLQPGAALTLFLCLCSIVVSLLLGCFLSAGTALRLRFVAGGWARRLSSLRR